MRTAVACAVIAAEVVAGVVALIVVTSSSSSSASDSPTTSSTSRTSSSPSSPSNTGPSATSSGATLEASTVAMVTWLRSALPLSTPLLADTAVAAELTKDGFTAVRTPDSPSGARFVVSTPALRSAAGDQPAVASALAGSQPVATAGTGDGAITVRQVTSLTASQLSDDASTRRTAEQSLLENANITADAASTAILRDGGLDLRPATVFALLSGNERIDIVSIQVDPLEQAAGRPARIVDVRTASTASLKTMLAAVAVNYQLTSVKTQPDGSVRLTWPVDVTSGGITR